MLLLFFTLMTYKKKNLYGLTDAELYESAWNRVLLSVSASEQSTVKIRTKLIQAGYPEKTVEEVIDHATEIGAVDDIRYANMLIRSCIASGKGIRKVQRDIERLGIEIESLDAYEEYLDIDREEMLETAVDFLRAHPTRAKNAYASCFRKLINRGFSGDVANAAVREYLRESDAL